jgi:repressor LexA
MMSLTPRQRELLVYIQTREVCPSFREMQAALGLNSKSSIHALLTGLEQRGHIRRLHGRCRAIEVLVPVPTGDAPTSPPAAQGRRWAVVDLPVYGRNRINWLADKAAR